MDIGTLTGAIAIEDQLSGALDALTSKIKQFATNFEGTFGYIAPAAGAAAAAIAGVTAAIVALGNQGSEINSVSESLDRFAGSASNADEIVEKMRAGTKGVVTDFTLMERATKLLGAGVKLNATQFGTLSQAAFLLQNQGLGPTKNMLELVTQAMIRGNTRTLEAAIGKIDLEAAEKKYAKSLNTTRDDLTDLEKTEARRAAILDALTKRVNEAGEQNMDFAATLESVSVSVKNWLADLAGIVAKSPAVWRALDSIRDSFNKAFGGSSKSLLDAVAHGIDTFADNVAKAVPYLMDFLKFIVDIAVKLWEWVEVIGYVAAAIVIFDGLTKAVGLFKLGVDGVTLAIWLGVDASIAFIAAWGPIAIAVAAIAVGLKLSVDAWQAHSAHVKKNADDAKTLKEINDKLGTEYKNLGAAVARMNQVKAEEAKTNAAAAAASAAQAAQVQTEADARGRVGRIAAEEAEQHAKSVKELYRTYSEGSKELAVTVDALNNLTAAQRENHEVLKRVVPDIIKLYEAGRTLTTQQIIMHATLLAQTNSQNAAEVAKLKDIGVTESMITHNLELGVTLTDMALQWGVTTKAVELHRAGMAKTLEASRNYAAFEQAARDEAAANRARTEERAKEAGQTIAKLEADYQIRLTERYLSDTEKRIAAIRREYAEKLLLAKVGKTPEQAAAIQAAGDAAMGLEIEDEEAAGQAERQRQANEYRDFLKSLQDEYAAVDAAAKAAAYGGLQDFFTALGQMSGSEGMGKAMQAAGGMVAGLQSAHNWSEQLGKNKQKLGGDFGALSVLFNDNAKGVQKFGAGLQAAAGIAQGAVAIWNATAQSASTVQNSLSGAMAGAQAGAMFGPWGMAVGAAAGLVTGIIRGKPGWAKAAEEIGRDFGVKVSDELAKTIDEQAKKKFRGSVQASSIYSMSDIVAEGGGVTDKNVLQYTEKLRDVFVMLETGAFTSAQAVKVLDENFESLVAGNTDSLGFWSDSLKEIIALNDKFGTQSKAIEAAIKQQAATAIQGFNMIMVGSTKARKGYEDLKKEIDDTTEEIKKLNAEPERGRGSEWTKKMTEAQEKLTKALAAQHKAGEGATRELKDLGTIAAATFSVAIAKGASFYEALAAAQPGLTSLRKAYENLGLNIEDPFLKMLSVQSRLMENQPELIQGVQGLGASIVAMTNLNMLNADSFAAMGRIAADQYTRIQGEVAAAGGTIQDALMPMQDYLHAAAKAAEELGLPLDEHTQMLIDQSKELGIWKEKAPSAAEAMQAATENLTVAINNLTTAIGAIPSSIPDPFAGWEGPPNYGDTGFDEGGTVGKDWRKRSSRDVIPAWLRRGEVVVTPEQMQTPVMKEYGGGSDGGGNGQPITVQLNLDGKKVTDVVINRLGGRLALGGVR